VAYAAITTFVTPTTDFPIIQAAIHQYEEPSGACLKTQKSKAPAVGRWSPAETVLGIEYYPRVKILGVTFWSCIEQSMNDSWTRLTGRVRMQAKNAYTRDPCLAHRVRYTLPYVLAKIWYTAQIVPAPSRYIQQITTAVTPYILKGAICTVPVSTLQRQNNMGGRGLVDIDAKCRALLLCRMHLKGKRVGTGTASWLPTWNFTGSHTNSPLATRISNKLAYMYIYSTDMAYINPPGKESSKHSADTFYITLHTMTVAAKGAREVRDMHLQPSTNWPKLWNNPHSAWITEQVKFVWFTVIHDIIPKNERLVKIRLTCTGHCYLSVRPDTIQRRITECGKGQTYGYELGSELHKSSE